MRQKPTHKPETRADHWNDKTVCGKPLDTQGRAVVLIDAENPTCRNCINTLALRRFREPARWGKKKSECLQNMLAKEND